MINTAKVFLWAIFLGVMGLIVFMIGAVIYSNYGANKQDRMSPEALIEAAGIVNGQVNELRIGGVTFRFPASYRFITAASAFQPDIIAADISQTRLKENKDAVSRVKLHMDLSAWFDPPPINLAEGNALVRIEISEHGYEDPIESAKRFQKKTWASQRDIPEWGLREYISHDFPERGGWGVLTYRSITERTIRGGVISYGCSPDISASRRNIAMATLCMSGYQSLQGPYVKYVVSGKLLPRWKEVHSEVINLVNSLIVEE